MSEVKIMDDNTREEVYSGTYILDGLPISEEEQRKKILEMMKRDGISVLNPEELEIVYEGAEDHYGESESLSTKFVVYRNHLSSTKKQEQAKAIKELEELKALREQLEKTVDPHDREQIMSKVTTHAMDESVAMDKNHEEEGPLTQKEPIEDVDSLKKDIEMLSRKYDAIQEKMDAIVKAEQEELNVEYLLSDEEIYDIFLRYLKLKKPVSKELSSLLGKIDQKRRILTILEGKEIDQPEVSKEEDTEEKKEDIEKSPLATFQALYPHYSSSLKIDVSRPLRIPRLSLDNILIKSGAEAAKIVGPSATPDYVPDKAPEDMKDTQVSVIEEPIDIEIIIDEDSGDYYFANDVIKYFDLSPISEERMIQGKPCYQFDGEKVEEIISKEEFNDRFHVFRTPIHLGKKPSLLPNDDYDVVQRESGDLVEKIVLYHDTEQDKIYIRKHLFKRFDLGETQISDEKTIHGAACYPISKEIANHITENASNSYSPYKVEIIDCQLDKREEPVSLLEGQSEENFGAASGEEKAEEVPGEKLLVPALNQYGPIFPLDLDEEPVEDVFASIDNIVNKLTDGLDLDKNLQESTVKTYRNKRVKCSKLFFDELKKDDYEYNIVGVLPAVIKASAAFLKKISAYLTLSVDSSKRLEKVETRFHELSEDELETLFAEYSYYAGDGIEEEIIHPLIVDCIREYQYNKIESCFAHISDSYKNINSILSEIREQEENDSENSSTDQQAIDDYYKEAAEQIALIIELRQKAGYYLSNESYGLDSYYIQEGKALIRDLAAYPLKDEHLVEYAELNNHLLDSISKNDYKAIVDDFIQLEAFFGKHGKSSPLSQEPSKEEIFDKQLVEWLSGALDEAADVLVEEREAKFL